VGVVTGGPCPGSSSLGPLAATRAVHANSHAGRGRLPTVGRVSCVSAGQKNTPGVVWNVPSFPAVSAVAFLAIGFSAVEAAMGF